MPTALITGASGGLGSAIAAALADTHTLLLAGRPSKRLSEVASRVGGSILDMDLTDVDGLGGIKELDLLVHNVFGA